MHVLSSVYRKRNAAFFRKWFRVNFSYKKEPVSASPINHFFAFDFLQTQSINYKLNHQPIPLVARHILSRTDSLPHGRSKRLVRRAALQFVDDL